MPSISVTGLLTEAGLTEDINTPGSATDVALTAAIAAKAGNTLGGNIPRTLGKLRNGENITIGVIGDSKEAPTTPGNVGGTATARLAALLQTRFGVTVTVVNVAESGDTAAVQFLGGGIATLVAAAPDLTVVNLGTNDSNSDASGNYAAGYVRPASYAAIERACAYLRDAKESAEFLFIGTTPYTPASTSNPKIVTYNKGIESLAAVVGAEFVSLYDAWWADATFQSSPTTYLYDSTHPNAAGNDFSAAQMLTRFPLAGKGVKPALAPRAVTGKYGVNRVNKSLGVLGYVILATAGSGSGCTLALTGSWTIDGNYDVTTTANDYFTLSGTSVKEFLVNIDLGSVSVGTSYPVVDFILDTVTIASNVNLHTQSGKDSAAYWLAPFTGLDGAAHTLKVVLKSGMLRVGSYAVLVGASSTFTPETQRIDLGAAATSQDLSDGTTKYLYNLTLNLPVGWSAAEVLWIGRVPFRATGTTTTRRQASVILRVNSTVLSTDYVDLPPVPTASESWYAPPAPVSMVSTITGNVNVKLEARAISTDKTQFFAATGGRLIAVLQRTA